MQVHMNMDEWVAPLSSNSVVMLSQAKNLRSASIGRSKTDPRFFSRDCGIRMTL